MHNKTIAHGCSFTRYGWPCWPAYVPWFNGGITMLNKGRSGSGNETISRAAINSAIEVDLTGQVCADSIGARMWSGVGGQMDFLRGAALSSLTRFSISASWRSSWR